MKKILLLLAVLFVAIGAQAAAKSTPVRRAQLAKNERLIGNYTTDEWNETGDAVTDQRTTLQVFTIVPSSEYEDYMNMDGKISAIRFALSELCEVKNVFVWGVGLNEEDDITPIVEVPVQGQTLAKGWNTVALNEPLAIPQEYDRLAFGFEYVQVPGAKPLSLVEGYSDEAFCVTGDMGEGVNTYNYSQKGFLSVQAIARMDKMPSLDVALRSLSLSSMSAAPGTTLEYSYIAYNNGTEDVTSYEIQVKLDDKLVRTITEKDNQMENYKFFYSHELQIPNDFARGRHILTLELTKVNGAAPTTGLSDDKMEAIFHSFMPSDVVPRQKFLIEELTSHSCTFCPGGAEVLRAMKERCPDLAIACIHGNQSSKDPFNTPECQSLFGFLGLVGYPSATFNRNYFSPTEGIVPGIGFSMGYDEIAEDLLEQLEENSLPAFASVDIEQSLSQDGQTLNIKVSGMGGEEAREVLKDYSLTVYVLEDSLKYRQLSFGTWVTNYVHNHVLRKVATAINGDDLKWTSGSTYENTFEVELADSWVREQLSVIAFISKRQPLEGPDWTDMCVTNANQAYLFEHHNGGGDDPEEDDTRVEAGLRITPFMTSMQLMGEGLSPNAKYVTGFNYATGTPCIWDTEDSIFVNFPLYEEASAHAINNDGMAVGSTLSYGGKAAIYHADGSVDELTDNGGANSQGADAWCISADGTKIGGFYYYFEWTDEAKGEGYYATFPCVWENKTCKTLSYPSSQSMGFNVDGAAIRWMSADGSVLLGYLVDDKGTWPAVIWRKNAQGEYVCDPICKDYFGESIRSGKPYMVFNPSSLSPNGEWITLTVQEAFDDSNFNNPIPTARVARYNLRTKALEVLNSDPLIMEPSAISDDGTVLLFTKVDGIFGRVAYVWKGGQSDLACLDDMLIKMKGVPAFGANVPAAFAADGQTYLGFGIDQDANIFSYVISIAEMEKALADGIETPTMDLPQTEGFIYNLAGQRLTQLQRGINIVNGKKVLVK